jgi:hypothetical protein
MTVLLNENGAYSLLNASIRRDSAVPLINNYISYYYGLEYEVPTCNAHRIILLIFYVLFVSPKLIRETETHSTVQW